jgi:hypothetical protein
VLSESFKPLAIKEGWVWVGTDLTEATGVSETNLAIRLITDLAVVTSALTLTTGQKASAGFNQGDEPILQPVNFAYLTQLYDTTPGLVVDKLKAVLEFVWSLIQQTDRKGVIFAYDEAQTLSDNSPKDQYPLSVLLDTFQSIQRKGIPFMLALVGLPTLFPKLVEARAYAERMFRVVNLSRLDDKDSRDAILKPIQDASCPVSLTDVSVTLISRVSGGYPYFIQFMCREVYDILIQKMGSGEEEPSIPIEELTRKLDSDFFAGRWGQATDRQRDLMYVISQLDNCDGEFSVQDIVDASWTALDKGFSNSQVNQMLTTLSNAGLVYKNRYGRYSFAVPLMSDFIKRQYL